MQNIKSVFIFLLLIIILNGCKNTKSPVSLFDKELQVDFLDLGVNTNLVSKPYCLTLCDSLLVFSDNYRENAFSAVNVNTGQLTRLGVSGEEPGEFSRGDILKSVGSTSNIYVFQCAKQKAYITNIDSFNNGTNYKPSAPFNLNQESSFILNFEVINDSLFLIAGNISGKRFGLIDNNSVLISTGIDFPKNDKQLSESKSPELAYQLDLTIKPDRSKFAFITYGSGNLSIFNLDNNNFSLLKNINFYNPEYKWMYAKGFASAIGRPKSKEGYVSINCTSNFIYALYTDNTIKNSKGLADIVLVFDWNGNPVKKYKLNKKVRYICVDQADKTLYALGAQAPPLIYFKL